MLWTGIIVAVGAATFVWLFMNLAEIRDRSLTVLCFVIWLRLMASALHEITYQSVAAGLSLNALLSIATIGFCFLFVELRLLALRVLVPVYALIGVTIVSALLNGEILRMIEPLSKWGYFLAIALLARTAIQRVGARDVFRLLSVAMLAPILLQVASVGLDMPKSGATTDDFSALKAAGLNYIGGYDHESVFSGILLMFLFVTVNASTRHGRIYGFLGVLWSFAGLFFANYRTALIGMGPIAVAYFFSVVMTSTAPKARPLVLLVAAFAGFGALAFVPQDYVDRFADVAETARGIDVIVKRPEEFTSNERELLTGRVHIWSYYIDSWRNGGLEERLWGFGPNSWRDEFPLYAHNTFVSQLYEFGLVGLAALVAFFSALTYSILRTIGRTETRYLLSVWLGFILFNLATMPLWQIEGMIFIALIAAAAWATRPVVEIAAPRPLTLAGAPPRFANGAAGRQTFPRPAE
ncbi:MAG: O-antigen ligase family protein [Pseudomonadota bacterium]